MAHLAGGQGVGHRFGCEQVDAPGHHLATDQGLLLARGQGLGVGLHHAGLQRAVGQGRAHHGNAGLRDAGLTFEQATPFPLQVYAAVQFGGHHIDGE